MKSKQKAPSLFDQIEIEDDKEKGEDCSHSHEIKTETDWGEKYGLRTTWTCLACGHIRGRML